MPHARGNEANAQIADRNSLSPGCPVHCAPSPIRPIQALQLVNIANNEYGESTSNPLPIWTFISDWTL